MRINTASVVLACLLATAEVFAVPVEDNGALVGRAGKTKPPPVKPPPTKPPPKSVAPPPPPKSVPPPPPPNPTAAKSSAPPPPPKSSVLPVKSSQPVSSLPPKSSAPASSKPIPPVSSSSMRALSSSAAPSSSLPIVLRCFIRVPKPARFNFRLGQQRPVKRPSSVVSSASSVITSAASSGSLVPSSSVSVLGSAVSSGSADPLASSASGSAVSSSAASVITSAASSGSQSGSVSASDSAAAMSSDAASSVLASSTSDSVTPSSASGSASASSASASASASAAGACAPRASGVSRRSSPPGSDGGTGDDSFCSWNDPNDSSYVYSEGDVGNDTLDPVDPEHPLHLTECSDRAAIGCSRVISRRTPRLVSRILTTVITAAPAIVSCSTERVFDFNPLDPGTPPPGTSPGTPPDRRSRFRFIRGNATYKFLPGESMIARQLTPRANKELIFNCNEQDPASLPEVCNNMCYGLNCLQINNEFKRETNTQQCAANRKKNACAAAVPNPCSTRFNGAGGKASLRNVRLSCDEFPFASTDVATAMTNNNLIATRCVDAKHNSRQGGKIGGFYRYVLGAGESFEVKFDYGNANGAQGSNDGPAGSATMGYCKAGVAKGNGQTCDKDDMQMN
ncbi:hypothetical protein B0H13DRAFT_2668917 [Mycena leptocephala]|nr:hypothetical protein B0H13DRAFT_2668917 [Mycena leptocephala]